MRGIVENAKRIGRLIGVLHEKRNLVVDRLLPCGCGCDRRGWLCHDIHAILNSQQ
jgi:hypothetical protein